MNKIINVKIGNNVNISDWCNIYGCELDDNVFIGPFVEIQKDARIGKNTRISSHSFICEKVLIGNNVFVAHGVMFINDLFDSDSIKNYIMKNTIIGDWVRIGSNSTILPVKIGNNAIIGAGSVVTKDVPENAVVAGNPAKILRYA
ncbi:MAG: acyltransferase, partial [Nanoarchaeota archaeon]